MISKTESNLLIGGTLGAFVGSLVILGIVVIFCNRKAIKEMRAVYLERRSSKRVAQNVPTENPPDYELAHPVSDKVEHSGVNPAQKVQQIKNELTI